MHFLNDILAVVRTPNSPRSPAEIRLCVSQIRRVRKMPISEISDEDVMEVLRLKREHKDCLKIQQSACQTLANICMNESIRERCIGMNCHMEVLDSLKAFGNDWKLCWLACSALWNMTLSPEARSTTPLDAVDVFMDILKNHETHERTIKVAIGCLSNLSLNHLFRVYIGGNREHVQFLYDVILRNTDHVQIASTASGLIANLAVNDDIANLLVEMDFISCLKLMLECAYDDETFQRNVVAALRNVRTGDMFVVEALTNEIIEELFKLLDRTRIQDMVSLPITMICSTLHASVPHRPSSYHIACYYGDMNVFDFLMEKNENCEDIIDFNMKDKFGHTLLTYAIEGGRREMVAYLISRGSSPNSSEYFGLSAEMTNTIEKALEDANIAQSQYVEVLAKITARRKYPRTLIELIAKFVPRYSQVF